MNTMSRYLFYILCGCVLFFVSGIAAAVTAFSELPAPEIIFAITLVLGATMVGYGTGSILENR